jgi:acetyl-CoA/propionyl-CoA carboxylase biotin carboxyl carrier protein
MRFPGGPGVRVDSGVTNGDEISGAFDSLLAKLIVTGSSRKDALERARRALDEFEVAGLPTVLPFHRDIVRNPAFAPEDDAPFSVFTRWIETEYDNQLEPWSGEITETMDPVDRTCVVVEVGGRRIEVSLPKKLVGDPGASGPTAGPAPRRRSAGHSVDTATGDAVKAPMQATVVKIAVAEGDKVVKGDLVLVLEAMKMEQPIVAHKDGVIGLVNAEAGSTVSSGHLLLAINDAPAA